MLPRDYTDQGCCKIGNKRGSKGQPPLCGGPGGVPQSLFLPRPQGAKKLCNSPATKRGSKGQPPLCGGLGASPSLFFLPRPQGAKRLGNSPGRNIRVVARSPRSGVLRGSRPFAGAWGRPPVSFFFRARRAQRDLATALAGISGLLQDRQEAGF